MRVPSLICLLLVITLLTLVNGLRVHSRLRIRKRHLEIKCSPDADGNGKESIREAMVNARKSLESGLSPGAQMVT